MPYKNRTKFAEAAGERVRTVQAALTDLLASAGVGGSRSMAVGRRLGLDKTLAWKVTRFVGSADVIKAFRHMPGPGGVEIVLRAAGEMNVGEAVLERVRSADREFRAFVAEHAGDRRTFEAMLAGEKPDPRSELEERRSYFRSGSTLWGVRAKLQFLMLALKPSATRVGYADAVQVSGFSGFERLRSDVPWIVRRLRAHSDSGAEVIRVVREPLVESRRARGLPPLFDPYCTQPLPELRQFERDTGWVYDELAPGEVGRAGATTVVLGERYMGALPTERAADNTVGTYTLTVRTPVECVLFDLLLHQDLRHFGRPRREMVGLLEDRPAPRAASGAAAADGEAREPAWAAELGGSAVVQTPRMASYSDMVRDALSIAGFGEVSSFRGYRVETEYPAFPCDVKMWLDINEAGG